jgi:hypothetical protein
MRRCLLRWHDERLFPTFCVFEHLGHGFSLNLRFLIVLTNHDQHRRDRLTSNISRIFRNACWPKPSAAWPPPAQRLSRSASRQATRPTTRPRSCGRGLSWFLALQERRDASNGAACQARCGPPSSRPGPMGRLGPYRGVKCRASAAAWWSITRRMFAFIVYTLITAVSSSRPCSP